MVAFSIHFNSPGTAHVDVDPTTGRVHLNFFTDTQNEILRRLDQLGADVETVKQQGVQLMSTVNDAQALLVSMNEVTNQLAAAVSTVVDTEAQQLEEIRKLREQIANGTPVTQAQLDGLVSGMTERRDTLTMVRDHLQTIASDPNNPTPPLPTAA